MLFLCSPNCERSAVCTASAIYRWSPLAGSISSASRPGLVAYASIRRLSCASRHRGSCALSCDSTQFSRSRILLAGHSFCFCPNAGIGSALCALLSFVDSPLAVVPQSVKAAAQVQARPVQGQPHRALAFSFEIFKSRVFNSYPAPLACRGGFRGGCLPPAIARGGPSAPLGAVFWPSAYTRPISGRSGALRPLAPLALAAILRPYNARARARVIARNPQGTQFLLEYP